VVSSISSIPKVGNKIIGKIETTPSGRASFVQSVTKNATVPTSIDCLISNIVYANPKRSRAIIIAINISLYSFIILKSPISFNGEALYLKIFDIEEGNHQEVV
jgi:hypothetical protein